MSQCAEVSRRYQMTRVREGDYLLPSNDLKTLWRITRYIEDGSAEWRDDTGKWHRLTGTFWAAAKYGGISPDSALADPDLLEWDRWESWHSQCATRAEAIRAALGDES